MELRQRQITTIKQRENLAVANGGTFRQQKLLLKAMRPAWALYSCSCLAS